MKKYRDKNWGKPKYKVEGIKCVDKPVCALVCAIFNPKMLL